MLKMIRNHSGPQWMLQIAFTIAMYVYIITSECARLFHSQISMRLMNNNNFAYVRAHRNVLIRFRARAMEWKKCIYSNIRILYQRNRPIFSRGQAFMRYQNCTSLSLRWNVAFLSRMLHMNAERILMQFSVCACNTFCQHDVTRIEKK